MGGSKDKSSGTKETQMQSFTPWSEQVPYLKEIYSQAQGLSGTPQQYYPGSTIAGQDPATTAALGQMEQRAQAGPSQLLGQAGDYTSSVMRGDYLNQNPYLDATYQRAAGQATEAFNRTVMPNLETRFAQAGRTGSPAYQGAMGEAAGKLSDSLSGMATDIYGRNYEAERGRQGAASQMAMPLSEMERSQAYGDIDRLGAVGAERERYEQQNLNDLIERFNFAQQEPWQRLGMYQGAIGSAIPGGGTSRGKQTPMHLDWGRIAAGAFMPMQGI